MDELGPPSIFYQPADGIAADFIPFYWQGQYHLFYLKDYRDAAGHGEGTPWFQIVTRDFVDFDDWGESLARGPEGSQDLWVFTGSVIERDGVFHIFYTGHNSHFANTEKPVQAVMHATSPDLRTWTKHPGDTFFAPPHYEKDDWRDPFVFWNEEAGAYWMLLAARHTTGPSRNRGLIALAASPDLDKWQVAEPFWAPDLYYTHECPDLFQIGDWWYLVYSTFSERSVTHYRMGRNPDGPWQAPANDTFDGRAYYAAKTAGDGHRHFIFGWLPSRDGETDNGAWQWGGNLVVHELLQRDDGSLAVQAPEPVIERFIASVPLVPAPILGDWAVREGSIAASARGHHSAISLSVGPDAQGVGPGTMLLKTEITFNQGTAAFGVLLRLDESMDRYYQVRFEPANQRIVIDRWPRPGDQPFMLERPLALQPGDEIYLRIFTEGTCLVVYANGVALSCRMYDHPAGAVGLFVTEGEARFSGTTVRTR